MKLFFMGIIVGLGAVAPGLSGSILLVMLGLYGRIVSAVTHIFRDFKKNILFLLPLGLGIGVGILLFSKIVDALLARFPMQINYAFLGLLLGAMPMLWKEVTREGFAKRHYAFSAIAFVFGVIFFVLNAGLFPPVTDPSFMQSVGLGFAVAAAYLVPGVDSFAILSSFGLYELWLSSVGNLNLSVLFPAALGLCIGALCISFLFHFLLARWYRGTYSIIFGVFISIVLGFVIRECEVPRADLETLISVVLFLLGALGSYAFSRLETLTEKKKEE